MQSLYALFPASAGDGGTSTRDRARLEKFDRLLRGRDPRTG